MRGYRIFSIRALAFGALLALTALVAGGCQHVEPNEGASEVRVISVDDAGRQSCVRLGETMVEVPAKIGFVKRGDEKVSGELETMARNAALELDGNAVAPTGKVEEGKRDYSIYRCE